MYYCTMCFLSLESFGGPVCEGPPRPAQSDRALAASVARGRGDARPVSHFLPCAAGVPWTRGPTPNTVRTGAGASASLVHARGGRGVPTRGRPIPRTRGEWETRETPNANGNQMRCAPSTTPASNSPLLPLMRYPLAWRDPRRPRRRRAAIGRPGNQGAVWTDARAHPSSSPRVTEKQKLGWLKYHVDSCVWTAAAAADSRLLPPSATSRSPA
jgi:hypothetical protein